MYGVAADRLVSGSRKHSSQDLKTNSLSPKDLQGQITVQRKETTRGKLWESNIYDLTDYPRRFAIVVFFELQRCFVTMVGG
ncbi:hypothetical protein TNCV_4107571 [Trichonephila clavipes]|nr:hypothetical protein TNCV_4107571 [Trichonephila clavipes]